METLLYRIDYLQQSRTAEECLALLNEQEHEQYQQRGTTYAYCRSELKRALARRSGIPAQNIENIRAITLQQNEHGKPYWASKPHLHFNISHSRNTLAIALGDSPLGIDVEYMKERSPQQKQNIAKRILHPEQIADLEQHAFASEIFYAYWCGVEALIKQRGLSLWQAKSLPLFLYQPSGSIKLEDGGLHLNIHQPPAFRYTICALAY